MTGVGAVTENDPVNTASGQLTYPALDGGNASFDADATAGNYGNLSLDSSGAWTYTLDAVKADPLKPGDIRSELFQVATTDGSVTFPSSSGSKLSRPSRTQPTVELEVPKSRPQAAGGALGADK